MSASLKSVAAKHTVDELHTMLALHAIAVREMAHGLCVLDADYRIVLFNRRFAEILGVDPALVRLGVSARVLFEQNDSEANSPSSTSTEMWREIEDMLLRRESFRLHRRFCDERIVDFHVRPTDGNGWVLTCERLTGKTAGEDAHHTAFLNQIIEHVNHGFACSMPSKTWFSATKSIFKYTATITLSSSPASASVTSSEHGIRLGIYADDVPGNLDRELDALFTQQEAVRRWTLADGRVIEMRIIPIEGGGWLTEHEDVTDSVRHEQALQDRNHLLDAALDHMAHGLCAFDDQLHLILVNTRYLEMYGLTPEDARPGTPLIELMRCSISRGIHLAGIDAEHMFADFKKRLIENKEPELHRHLADGRVIAVRHQPMAGGGWVGTYEDITERYRAEESIAHIARHDA